MEHDGDKRTSVGLSSGEPLGAEKLSVLLQMYNMAHGELLVRIQQRDQYHVCMIGALIAVSVGLFSMDDILTPTSSILLRAITFWLSLISSAVMLFLTHLLCKSYTIYENLITYVEELEKRIVEEGLKPDMELWQGKIDDKLGNHRKISRFCAKTVFFIMDAFLLGITILTGANLIVSF